MSYDTQARLAVDAGFTNRVSACVTQQSQANASATDPPIAALAHDWLTDRMAGTVALLGVWLPIMAAEPGFADLVDNGDGTIDSTKITDQHILSSCQARYPEVAQLLYDDQGGLRA
jgi:hypothetical protein